MALPREFLQGMGLTEEQINAIVKGNADSIAGLKSTIEELTTAKEDSEKKLAKVQKELNSLKEETDASNGKNPWKLKYDALKEQYDTFKIDTEKKAIDAAKKDAYSALLKKAGVSEKRIAAVLKVSDIDSVELDEDGKIKDEDKLMGSIKEEWGDFIITSQGTQGANTSTPPANTGGKKTKDEILAIKDTTERQKAMAENHELFGIV